MEKMLMDIIACPKCKDGLEIKDNMLVCKRCRPAYHFIHGDIPNLLEDEADKL